MQQPDKRSALDRGEIQSIAVASTCMHSEYHSCNIGFEMVLWSAKIISKAWLERLVSSNNLLGRLLHTTGRGIRKEAIQ